MMSDSKRKDRSNNPGMQMREKAMAIAMKRKEEYLGARVPKALKDRVINKADEMGIPVSLLIRRTLEAAFSESITQVTDVSLNAEPTVVSQPVGSQPLARQTSQNRFEDIIGWKNMEVNQDRSCERCREPLPKGTVSELGFTSSNAGYVIVCHQCKTQLSNA